MNPLFNRVMQPQHQTPNINDFASKLKNMDNAFLVQMEQRARQQGISEQDIMQGKQFIQNLLRSNG